MELESLTHNTPRTQTDGRALGESYSVKLQRQAVNDACTVTVNAAMCPHADWRVVLDTLHWMCQHGCTKADILADMFL